MQAAELPLADTSDEPEEYEGFRTMTSNPLHWLMEMDKGRGLIVKHNCDIAVTLT